MKIAIAFNTGNPIDAIFMDNVKYLRFVEKGEVIVTYRDKKSEQLKEMTFKDVAEIFDYEFLLHECSYRKEV